METFRQIHLPAAAGASLRVSSSVADIRFTIFMPDPRLKSSANLNGWNARMIIEHLKVSNARARVAKGTPGMTSINQWWRAGARQETALAGCEGMSVRHPRTRQMMFVNGNREWLARSYWLSA